jgi:hypothetical protein
VETFDPDRLRWIGQAAYASSSKPQRLPRHSKGEAFLKGPIPLRWLTRAAKLPGKSLQTALVLWHLVSMRRGAIRPSRNLLDRFGVSRHAARRAYAELERAGLVSVVREVGKSPTIQIRDVPGEGHA